MPRKVVKRKFAERRLSSSFKRVIKEPVGRLKLGVKLRTKGRGKILILIGVRYRTNVLYDKGRQFEERMCGS